jgi:1-acyl-sn-glycerol-3-phosphate acyltransferase
MKRYPYSTWMNALGWCVDAVVTVTLWTYYTLGFVVLFSPFYLAAFLVFRKSPEKAFQYLNSLFYKGFWLIVRLLIPMNRWKIQDGIADIRSSVIICNHVSYLDPLYMMALYKRHSTIVKSRLFAIPVFGTMLTLSGYIPSAGDSRFSKLMFHRLDRLDEFLASGGNLFIFPEGTRSRDNRIGELNKGAFKIARLCKAPLVVLHIRNTNRLFRPGEFLFHTLEANTIVIDRLADILPDENGRFGSVTHLAEQVKTLWENHGRSEGSEEVPEAA